MAAARARDVAAAHERPSRPSAPPRLETHTETTPLHGPPRGRRPRAPMCCPSPARGPGGRTRPGPKPRRRRGPAPRRARAAGPPPRAPATRRPSACGTPPSAPAACARTRATLGRCWADALGGGSTRGGLCGVSADVLLLALCRASRSRTTSPSPRRRKSRGKGRPRALRLCIVIRREVPKPAEEAGRRREAAMPLSGRVG